MTRTKAVVIKLVESHLMMDKEDHQRAVFRAIDNLCIIMKGKEEWRDADTRNEWMRSVWEDRGRWVRRYMDFPCYFPNKI